jgi:hypothetical protein
LKLGCTLMVFVQRLGKTSSKASFLNECACNDFIFKLNSICNPTSSSFCSCYAPFMDSA